MMSAAGAKVKYQTTSRIRRCLWALAILTCSVPGVRASVPGPVPQHPDASGIDWFPGDVDAAFAAARRANKPVFLYWGAQWCPPCQQLKSTVFARSDFIAKSHAFVAVYLDGDDPGAQRWGETFHVSGYPTVVILRPDRREITRISGGLDVASFADVLDSALLNLEPIKEVIARLRLNPTKLAASDCQRIAYYAWDLSDVDDVSALAPAIAAAADACPTISAIERARLTIVSGELAPTPAVVTGIIAIVADHALAGHVVDALERLTDPFFDSVRSRGSAITERFLEDWSVVMQDFARNPKVVIADQLDAIGTQLAALKRLAKPPAVPAALAAAARARASEALRQPMNPYVRAGVVSAAFFIYDGLDDTDAEYSMLKAELETAKAPYYYMDDLGEIEEKRGNPKAALYWFERAYRESQGVATRFQWGDTYLEALLRLAPQNHAQIRRVALEVIMELNGPERIQARTRHRLEMLDAELRKWSKEQQARADIQTIHAHMAAICTQLPRTDSGLTACRKFLASVT